MRYLAFTPELEHTPKIIVDTADCGRGLQLSHFPRNRTPPEFKADLSAEVALRWAAHPRRAEYLPGADVDVVTNDHFHCDGMLAAYTVLRPAEALAHRAVLVDAAQAGDFFELVSPRAVQFTHLVEAFMHSDRSPLARDLKGRSKSERNQQCTDAIVAEMPGLLYAPERYRDAWEESYRRHLAQLALVDSGRVRVCEYPGERLTVMHTPELLGEYARNHAGQGHRLLQVIERGGERLYVLHYRITIWYDLISRPTSIKPRLHDLAARLDLLETDHAARWAITEWNPALRRVSVEPDSAGCAPMDAAVCPSSIAVDQVVTMLRQELRARDEMVTS
jgi:hypothetical protein